MNRTTKLQKLGNAIREYRGVFDTARGKCRKLADVPAGAQIEAVNGREPAAGSGYAEGTGSALDSGKA